VIRLKPGEVLAADDDLSSEVRLVRGPRHADFACWGGTHLRALSSCANWMYDRADARNSFETKPHLNFEEDGHAA
jgi:hypothetical protein